MKYEARIKNGSGQKGRDHVISVEFDTPDIPHGPPEQLQDLSQPVAVADQARIERLSEIVEFLKTIFADRPIWSRLGIEAGLNGKGLFPHLSVVFQALPYVAYQIPKGPWRMCWIRYGYDPRLEKDSKIYQVVDMRSLKLTAPTNRGVKKLLPPSQSKKPKQAYFST